MGKLRFGVVLLWFWLSYMKAERTVLKYSWDLCASNRSLVEASECSKPWFCREWQKSGKPESLALVCHPFNRPPWKPAVRDSQPGQISPVYKRYMLTPFRIWFFSFGTGRGGRVGTHGGTLSSYIVKNIALDKTDDSNPREAILRHAKAAEDNPYWVSPAYSK